MKLTRKSLDAAGDVACLWKNPRAARGYTTAISWHGHTLHSREFMDFIPHVFAKIPLAGRVLDALSERRQRHCGLAISYHRAFWRPPLHAHAAHDLEAAQIREKLGLNPLVALTDHDDLEACADLHALGIRVPYALEWTVPFGATIFHLGIYNLPPEQARGFAAMAGYTARPEPHRLRTAGGTRRAAGCTDRSEPSAVLRIPHRARGARRSAPAVSELARLLDARARTERPATGVR